MSLRRTAPLAAALSLAAAPAHAKVLWTADATRPVRAEWASYAARDQCAVFTDEASGSSRISQVAAPPGSPTRRAYRFALRAGDVCFGGARAELAQGNPGRHMPDGVDRRFLEGQERWISLWLRFEPGYPIAVDPPGTFNSLIQFKQHGVDSPPFNLGLEDGRFALGRTIADKTWRHWPDVIEFGRPRAGVVYRLTWHVGFSASARRGFVQLFADLADGRGMTEVVRRTPHATLRRGLPSHLRIGPYRSSGAFGGSVSEYGGVTVATTRPEAEARAFGG